MISLTRYGSQELSTGGRHRNMLRVMRLLKLKRRYRVFDYPIAPPFIEPQGSLKMEGFFVGTRVRPLPHIVLFAILVSESYRAKRVWI